MLTQEEANIRCGRGAEFLDQTYPNWWKKVNAFRLKMNCASFYPSERSSYDCVGAQLDKSHGYCKSYGSFVHNMSITPSQEVSFGFTIYDRYEFQNLPELDKRLEMWEMLNVAWTNEIDKRENANALSKGN